MRLRVIYRLDTRQIMNYAEEAPGVAEIAYPIPRSGEEELVILEGVDTATLETAFETSHGAAQSGYAAAYLHDEVSVATRSTRTRGKGAKAGHKAVEAEAPRPNTPTADVIEERRKARGQKLDAPVTIAELREAEGAV